MTSSQLMIRLDFDGDDIRIAIPSNALGKEALNQPNIRIEHSSGFGENVYHLLLSGGDAALLALHGILFAFYRRNAKKRTKVKLPDGTEVNMSGFDEGEVRSLLDKVGELRDRSDDTP
ncbi:hypothetical protein [Leekyejoonella antrihumi]|uniref:Uncharacterized protein n=1 Tax=Leekyejoonella antrihumi TaxID=1660198 RepID=A0A563DT74_9MICO|nr:hypothetical protein [Leekyejoonella antrihumi]TWP33141.1 hypothetical protein FGL98_22355 [Leekyejoonella antrihumi]